MSGQGKVVFRLHRTRERNTELETPLRIRWTVADLPHGRYPCPCQNLARAPPEPTVPQETCNALKGLSSMLFVIGSKLNGDATIQEVQCLWADGYKVLTSANDTNETSRLGQGLGKVGLALDGGLDTLKPCYLALRNAEDSSGWFAGHRSKGSKLWPKSPSLYTPGLHALGTWAGWDAELAKYLADRKLAKNKRPKDFDNDETALEGEVKKGYGLMGIAGMGVTAPTAVKWSAFAPDGLLETSTTRQLKIIQATVPASQSLFLHAEQNLLLAFAEHLRAQGTAVDLHVAGQKPPCAGCKPVINAFTTAYKAVYAKTLTSDANTDQSATSKKNTGRLVLPEPESGGTESNYAKFVARYEQELDT